MPKCRSCEAEVLWVTMESGRRMPVNPEPMEGGNLQLDPEQEYARVRTDGEGPRYVTHYATCPQAKIWRKGKKQ